MPVIVLLAKLALVAVLAVAGWSKLLDRAGTRAAATALGAPSALAGAIAVLLPPFELTLAMLLIAPPLDRAGAAASAALLSAFAVVVALNVMRGRRPSCRCFGELAAAPIGWTTVARNAALAACAGTIAMASPQPLPSPLASLSLAVHVVETAALFALMRRHGALLRRVEQLDAAREAAMPAASEALPIGVAAPALDRVREAASTAGAGAPALLVFVEADCPPCRALWPEMAAWERAHRDVAIVAVATGAEHATRRLARENGVRHLVSQREHEIADRYHVTATPSAVLVDAEGRIASQIAIGRDEIAELIHPNVRLQTCA